MGLGQVCGGKFKFNWLSNTARSRPEEDRQPRLPGIPNRGFDDESSTVRFDKFKIIEKLQSLNLTYKHHHKNLFLRSGWTDHKV